MVFCATAEDKIDYLLGFFYMYGREGGDFIYSMGNVRNPPHPPRYVICVCFHYIISAHDDFLIPRDPPRFYDALRHMRS